MVNNPKTAKIMNVQFTRYYFYMGMCVAQFP